MKICKTNSPIRIVLIALFVLINMCFCETINSQNKKLDSLIAVYKAQKADSLKAETLNHIIQIELYNSPKKVKDYIDELIQLSRNINYKKGEAKGYYRNGGYFFNRSELDSAEYYFKKSMFINTHIDNIEGIINDNVQISLVYMNKNKFDLTYDFLNRNIELYKNRDSSKKDDTFIYIGSTYHTLTNAYTQQGKYNLALESELQALKLYNEITENKLYRGTALNSLGDIENRLGNYQKALEYLNEANSIFKENDNIFFQTIALTNIANSYSSLKQYEKSIEINKKGIELSQQAELKGNEAKFWGNLGNQYENLGQINKAIDCQKKAIAIYNILGNQISILYPYTNLGNLYRKVNDFKNSKLYLDKAIEAANSNDLNKIGSLAYDYRSRLHQKIKQYDLALEDYKNYTRLKDSMYNETKSQQIEELRTIHETEKKEQQITLQENEIDLLEQKAKVSDLQKLLLGSGLLLSLGLVGFGFYAFKQKLKRNKVEKEKLDNELAFKKKELTTHALHLAKKNEVLASIKNKAEELKIAQTRDGYQHLIRTIDIDLQDDNNWENFSNYFQQVHKDFNAKIKEAYPSISASELRFLSLVKMNLSSKEIASILNISNEGIKKARYRVRKKIGLQAHESLEDLILST